MGAPRCHVVVVDDEPDLTTLYRLSLEGMGYRVSVANSGREALDRIRADPPRVVVLDIRLPDIDGLELMARILHMHPQTAVVLNSGYACYKESFLSWAAEAYVVKSSNLFPLLSAVERIARLDHLGAAADPPATRASR